ncbi:MAG: AAA family ATPase, partial [Acidobacteriota bacterium]|nr:AAA family ATPase [Acidobacteriota bacterium]
MLRLKEVELLGFKSFADRTRLICDGTTAAVVGPNGCGKSNLSDAVSWVLGEQSARMLRGERMSDVIFNGTSRRPPTGMAEVSIVLAETGDECEGVDELERVMAVGPQWGQDAAEGKDAADGHAATVTGVNGKPAKRRAGDEIKVTRRLFRSGESEYLLNGSLCRLRDIQDIFMGTGLGPESYAIIEQGRIGQILSSKPADRRSIIEEAAGVSKFKTRKRLAEAKLESSRQNLARINDILEEISKQASSLKRQASKAERYKELREDLRACQKLVFVSKLTSLEAERQRLAEALSAIQGEMATAAAELETLESGRNAAASRFEELEEDLKRTREALMRSELESERMRSSLARAREQAAALGMRSAESRAGQLRLEEQAAALDKESLARSQHSAMVRAEMGGACGAVQELASRQTELAALLAAGESEVETLRREMLLAVSRISEIRNETVKAEEAGLSAGRDLARVEAERAEAEKELQYFSQELDAIRASYALDKEALAGLQASAVNARAALDAGRKEAADLAAEAERLRHEFDRASARRQAVGESLARHAYSTESVRSLLSTPNEAQNFHPLGVLADFLEVSPGYEAVVEEVLKAQLDCVVVERLPEARQGIALLKNGGGRSTFFIKDYPQRGSEQGLDEEDGQEAKAREGVVAQLSEVVRFDARLGLNGTSVFPSLGRSFVVESPLAAERLAAEFPFCHFITLEGEHYHQRWVSGGKGATAGPLALRREYRDLDRRAGEIESAIAACEQRWSESKDRLKGREDEVQEFEAARNDAEKRVMLAGEKLRQADESAARAGMRASTHERERSLLQAEYEKTGLLVLQLKAELETAGAAREFKEKEIEAAAGSVRSRRDELDAMNQSLT